MANHEARFYTKQGTLKLLLASTTESRSHARITFHGPITAKGLEYRIIHIGPSIKDTKGPF